MEVPFGCNRPSSCFCFLLWLAVPALGQTVNNWTNPASAQWEASYWSLGILPDASQTVTVTNSGYKAVNVSGSTFTSALSSVTVSNLTIAAPTNALSTVLLDYAGLNTTFKVLNSVSIDSNGKLQNSFSSLEIDGVAGGTLDINGGGAFVQAGGLTVASVPINVRNGSMLLNYGNMTLGALSLGTNGGTAAGTMDHVGGSVAADSVTVNHGAYDLEDGILYALGGTTVNSGSSTFHQTGGTNYGNVSLNDSGSYNLDFGLVQGDVLSTGGFSRFTQNGGLVSMDFLNITGPGNVITIDDPIGFYLRAGETRCGTLNIGGYGVVEQDGGLFILTNNFDLHGNYFVAPGGPIIDMAYFMLVNGTLSSPSITVGPYAAFNQRNGTNQIAGGLTVINSEDYLTGGWLFTTSTGIGAGAYFGQFGGSHYVNGVLSLSGRYDLAGGTLRVQGFYLRGTLNVGDGAFINDGLTDLGGDLHAADFVIFGQVRLSTNALFDLTSSSAQIHCSNSAGVAWTPGMFLVVSNWHAAGLNAVYFGTDATGLTDAQLAQVRFVNPAGMAPGFYAAAITSTGEIVPVPRPVLQTARNGSNLVISWTGSDQLLSATNVGGPYEPLSGASSPYTVDTRAAPQLFFRLSGQ